MDGYLNPVYREAVPSLLAPSLAPAAIGAPTL